jgi:phosphate transport system substrate-binding protein
VKLRTLTLAALMGATSLVAYGPASARDKIQVVGSSTVFPYTQAVAEEYANKTGKPAPIVESTGTGGGMKIFCQGVGPDHPDVTGASRAMKESEWKLCNDNGVKDITEVLIGYDGLSIAVSRASEYDWNLTEEQIYKALAAELPDDKGGFVPNPNQKWSDVDPSLPDIKIEAFGPPPTSGTRDAFVELAMHDGCDALPAMKALKETDSKLWNEKCSRMRQDGLFIEAGENDNLIVQRLVANAAAVGIFGYSFLYENSDKLKAVKVEGVEPNFDTIADGSYDISRPIFVYFKNAHIGVIPGLEEFVKEYVSDAALAPDGYLAERGLTTLSDEKRKEVQDTALNRKSMNRYIN